MGQWKESLKFLVRARKIYEKHKDKKKQYILHCGLRELYGDGVEELENLLSVLKKLLKDLVNSKIKKALGIVVVVLVEA